MKRKSAIALVLCYFIMIYAAFFFCPKWKQTRTEATISWDVSGYYMYLPALFIYNDLKHCGFKDSVISKYYPTPDFHQAFVHESSGNYVMKYSSGQAIAMLPWFFVAHVWATVSHDYIPDGFSYPYQFCIGVGMLLYGLLGLYVLRKILLRYFSDSVVAITLISIVVGTNYLNYAAIDQAMTHSVLFTLYTLIIWCSIGFYDHSTYRRSVVLGLLCGFATLIRPTEIISILIPLLWGINSFSEIKERIILWISKWKNLVLFSLSFLAVVAIQLVYWKWTTNEWLVYSYQDQGFSWLHPHLKNYLFSYRCGWLLYCPLMLLAFLGIYPLYRFRVNFISVVFLMLSSLYIVSAWDIWDYGGTAGRAMVQYYPIFSFPLAALISFSSSNRLLKLALYAIIGLFAYLSIWWTYHAHRGTVQVLELTKEYYWRKVGRWSGNDADMKLLDNKYSFTGTLKDTAVVYDNNFSSDTSQNVIEQDGNKKIKLNEVLQSTDKYYVSNNGYTQKWMRAYGVFKCGLKEWNTWKQAQFIVTFYNRTEEIQQNRIKLYRLLSDGEEEEIYLDAKCPAHWTQLSVQFNNAGSDKYMTIDNLKVVLFNE